MAAAEPLSSSSSSRSRGAPVGGPRAGSNNRQQVVGNPADALRADAGKHSAGVSAAVSGPQPAQAAGTPTGEVPDQHIAQLPAATTVNTFSAQQIDRWSP